MPRRSASPLKPLLGAVLALAALLATILVPSSAVRAAAPATVFDDALDPAFQNWSWASTNLESQVEVNSGSVALSVDYGPWEGLYLARPAPTPLAPNAVLEFWMHGGVDGGEIWVTLTDGAQNTGPMVTIEPPPQAWTKYSLPVSELGQPAMLGGVWVQNASGDQRSTMHVDDIRIVEGEPVDALPGPALTVALGTQSITRTTVDPASGQSSETTVSFPHPISDQVYGLNFAEPGLRTEISPGVNRWGGNAVERFNHTNGTTNTANDYFFMANPGSGAGDDHAFETANQQAGAATLLTVPGIGWVAKDDQARCGYPLDEYAPMDASATHWLDPALECGNGMRNGERIPGDPATTSVAVGPAFTHAWVRDLVETHGPASSGGVETYAIGNEPGLWHLTHADVVSAPASRGTIINTNLRQAAAIKRADPSAAVAGPVLWGGFSYFVTSAEFDANQRPGDVSTFVEAYLQAMDRGEAIRGQRLLDTLAVNFYDDRVYDGGTDALRLSSTRSLWDPTYAPQDWWVIRDFVGEGYAVIPRMQSLINRNYPGTELAITEYNFGALDTLAGGLAQADALGIFGREGLDAAMLWDPFNEQLSPPASEFANRPGMWAFRMFRNYDGDRKPLW